MKSLASDQIMSWLNLSYVYTHALPLDCNCWLMVKIISFYTYIATCRLQVFRYILLHYILYNLHCIYIHIYLLLLTMNREKKKRASSYW